VREGREEGVRVEGRGWGGSGTRRRRVRREWNKKEEGEEGVAFPVTSVLRLNVPSEFACDALPTHAFSTWNTPPLFIISLISSFSALVISLLNFPCTWFLISM
jgi:hypothetical protein